MNSLPYCGIRLPPPTFSPLFLVIMKIDRFSREISMMIFFHMNVRIQSKHAQPSRRAKIIKHDYWILRIYDKKQTFVKSPVMKACSNPLYIVRGMIRINFLSFIKRAVAQNKSNVPWSLIFRLAPRLSTKATTMTTAMTPETR